VKTAARVKVVHLKAGRSVDAGVGDEDLGWVLAWARAASRLNRAKLAVTGAASLHVR